MPDVLIRNFPADDLVLLDEQAARMGVSRAEYLRRQLQQAAGRLITPVTVDDLTAFNRDLPDLANPEMMTDAWK